MEYACSFSILFIVSLIVSILAVFSLFLLYLVKNMKKRPKENARNFHNLLFAGGIGHILGNDDVIKEIWTYEDLCNIQNDLSANYKLMADIIVPYYFETIGSREKPFTGSIDMRDHCLFHEGNGIKNFFIWIK